MKIWTIQPHDILDTTDKIIYPDDDVILKNLTNDNWTNAYNWMAKQTVEHIGNGNSKYPFWGWVKYNWNNNIDDMYIDDLRDYAKNPVIICLNISDDQLLQSDFNAWHSVLNNSPFISATNEPDFDAEYDAYDNMERSEYNKKKEESWSNVFDVTPFKNEFCEVGRYVQGTFWNINKDNIVEIVEV